MYNQVTLYALKEDHEIVEFRREGKFSEFGDLLAPYLVRGQLVRLTVPMVQQISKAAEAEIDILSNDIAIEKKTKERWDKMNPVAEEVFGWVARTEKNIADAYESIYQYNYSKVYFNLLIDHLQTKELPYVYIGYDIDEGEKVTLDMLIG